MVVRIADSVWGAVAADGNLTPPGWARVHMTHGRQKRMSGPGLHGT